MTLVYLYAGTLCACGTVIWYFRYSDWNIPCELNGIYCLIITLNVKFEYIQEFETNDKSIYSSQEKI